MQKLFLDNNHQKSIIDQEKTLISLMIKIARAIHSVQITHVIHDL